MTNEFYLLKKTLICLHHVFNGKKTSICAQPFKPSQQTQVPNGQLGCERSIEIQNQLCIIV